MWDKGSASTHAVIDATGLELFALSLDQNGFDTHTFVAAGRYRYETGADPTMAGVVSVPVKGTLLDGSPTRIRVRWASTQASAGYA